jgi:hypothetical protein
LQLSSKQGFLKKQTIWEKALRIFPYENKASRILPYYDKKVWRDFLWEF